LFKHINYRKKLANYLFKHINYRKKLANYLFKHINYRKKLANYLFKHINLMFKVALLEIYSVLSYHIQQFYKQKILNKQLMEQKLP